MALSNLNPHHSTIVPFPSPPTKALPRPFWAGSLLPSGASNKHFCVVGTTGSGKTITLHLLMQSVLASLGESGADQRALIYDAKQDILSYLHTMVPGVPVKILHPFDRRCARWDIARDVTSPVSAQQLAAILVPEDPNSNNRFFSDAARHLLTGVMLALIYHTNKNRTTWTLRDVVLAGRSRSAMQALFATCPYTQDLLVYFETAGQETASILTTIASRLAPFEPIAAVWEKATDTFSVREWLGSEKKPGTNWIVVLGSDEGTRVALDAINQAIFKRITELVLAQGENEARRTWFFFDEVREAGRLEGLSRLLTKGRSKGACVVLGFQDIEGLRAVYGNNVANEIVGQCGSKAILRLSSPETAQWASNLSGRYLRAERSVTDGVSHSQQGSNQSSSESISLQERPAIYTSEFLNLPFPREGSVLSAFYWTAEGMYPKDFDPFPLLPQRDPLVRDFWERPESEQYLEPWDDADKARIFPPPPPSASSGAAGSSPPPDPGGQSHFGGPPAKSQTQNPGQNPAAPDAPPAKSKKGLRIPGRDRT